MTCKWVASDQQRVVVGRHGAECPEKRTETALERTHSPAVGANANDGITSPIGTIQCPGCLPCTETHCYGDACRGRNHAATICADCLAAARTDLAAIVTMCGYPLLEEVLRSGVTSEAAMLLGPSADPEAWANRAMSAMMGRVDAAYLEECRDEMHPLWVLGTWEQLWREDLNHDTDQRATIGTAAAYLGVQMTYMASRLEPPFDEFGRDLRTCRAYLERVLHDQAQGDRAGVGCFECGAQLERKLTKREGFEDVWTCKGCHRKYTYAEYNFALRAALEANA